MLFCFACRTSACLDQTQSHAKMLQEEHPDAFDSFFDEQNKPKQQQQQPSSTSILLEPASTTTTNTTHAATTTTTTTMFNVELNDFPALKKLQDAEPTTAILARLISTVLTLYMVFYCFDASLFGFHPILMTFAVTFMLCEGILLAKYVCLSNLSHF